MADPTLTWPTLAEADRVIDVVRTTMWEYDGITGTHPGAWLRAWPSGHVHYSRDWCARLDGKVNTECGKALIFWPESEWPAARVCEGCADAFRALAALTEVTHG